MVLSFCFLDSSYIVLANINDQIKVEVGCFATAGWRRRIVCFSAARDSPFFVWLIMPHFVCALVSFSATKDALHLARNAMGSIAYSLMDADEKDLSFFFCKTRDMNIRSEKQANSTSRMSETVVAVKKVFWRILLFLVFFSLALMVVAL